MVSAEDTQDADSAVESVSDSPALGRRVLAEATGTALLVAFGAGSFVAAFTVGGGADLTYPAIGFIALTFGLVVAAVVYIFGPVSGAHINPAVTIALATVRRFPWREAGPYVLAQLVGAAVGAVVVNVMFGASAVTDNVSGGTKVQTGFGTGQALLAEAVGTALVLFTIMALAIDRRAPTGWAGWGIGLAVACEILVIGPISNGSVNPARTFGPYVSTTLFGGSAPWGSYWIYIVGPVVGAVLAVLAYQAIAAPRD